MFIFRMEDLGVISDDDLYLRIKYDGTVEWEPPRLFITYCEVYNLVLHYFTTVNVNAWKECIYFTNLFHNF